jgi:hypothetical protein
LQVLGYVQVGTLANNLGLTRRNTFYSIVTGTHAGIWAAKSLPVNNRRKNGEAIFHRTP